MKNGYDHNIAQHYAAYRPPLHALILAKCFNRSEKFHAGLDIGCGTGQSAVALSKYCEKVFGGEPSQDMLHLAKPHDSVTYQHFDGKNLDFPDHFFDVITFAGSLFYAKSQYMLDEVIRVGMDQAIILVYDFEILLYSLEPDILPQLAVSDYDHIVDFSGLQYEGLIQQGLVQDDITLQITPSDLAHLILADKNYFQAIASKYHQPEPYFRLEEELQRFFSDDLVELPVKIYHTKYVSHSESGFGV